jgi:restriction system protein
MARKRKTGLASDLMALVAMLPWWFGVVLAAILYWSLHQVASQQIPVTAQSGQFGGMAVRTIWKTVASIAQYILPLICLAGAGMSAWQRRHRQTLVADVAQSKASDALDGMSWRDFEVLVGEGFRLQGYQVVETGGGGADGGVDLVLTRGGEKFLVQCKQWRAIKVGVDVVRELYGVMAARGATGGFVVTSGRFTDAATGFASGRNLKLVDGPRLHELLRQAQATKGRAPATVAPAVKVPPAMPTKAPMALLCPICSKSMVKRMAKRGSNVGEEFWGCTGYPACRGTRSTG